MMNWFVKLALVYCFIFVFSTSAFATTQYYYLRVSGAGSNSGDAGTWTTVPMTDANAMSRSNFNDSGNWSKSDNAGKLDPDDVVFVKGSGWTWNYSLTPTFGITLDFYEPGDYDAETMSQSITPIFRSNIRVEVDNVTIQDGRFGGAARSIIVGANHGSKVQNNKVLRNFFDISNEGGWAACYWGFVCDSEFAYNSVEGIPQKDCVGGAVTGKATLAKALDWSAGSRNKVHHNHIRGGSNAIFLNGSRTWDDDYTTVDYPSATINGTTYTADPDAAYQHNEIAYNKLYRRCDEGISYDVSGSPGWGWATHVVERDTVQSVNGTTVKLKHSNWTGKGNLYSGYWMTSIANSAAKFGRHSMIKVHSGDTFTLENAISNLQAGDMVTIGMVFRRNWIHHNEILGPGYGYSSILTEGIALENIYEYNYTIPRTDWWEPFAISLNNLDGYTQATNSVTSTNSCNPSAFNIVRNNTLGAITNRRFDKGYGSAANYTTYNDAIYDNTLHQNNTYMGVIYPGKVILGNAFAYVNNNTGSIEYDNTNCGLQSTNPTGYVSDWFRDNWGYWDSDNSPSSLYSPKNVQVQKK